MTQWEQSLGEAAAEGRTNKTNAHAAAALETPPIAKEQKEDKENILV